MKAADMTHELADDTNCNETLVDMGKIKRVECPGLNDC